jgi:alanyl-tRNA synthetase
VTLTERLFWHDPYQQTFTARITRRLDWEGRPAVVLHATCFYPTSGGQPHDTGHLNDLRVLDVVEHGDEIVHVLEAPLIEEHVEGCIDWARRLDHMQQHAGQHILSGAFVQTLGANTVSFHLGPEASTIDLDVDELSMQTLDEVEELANHIVIEGRPIQVAQHDETSIKSVPLRKAPQVDGLVRVVSIPEFDYSACGGTHPRTSSEVGLIHIERWERHQGQARVTFLCGLRAVRDYRHKSRISRELAARYSVALDELPAALDRLEAAADETRRSEARLRTQVLELETTLLTDKAEQVGNRRIVCHYLVDMDAAGMRQIAQQLIQEPGMVVALGVSSPSPQFCLARSADVVWDMVAIATELAGRYGGRGGGRPHMAQGGGLSRDDLLAMLDDARARFRSLE